MLALCHVAIKIYLSVMNDDYLENLFYILSTHNIDKYHKDTKPLMHTPLSYCTPTSKTIL